MSNEIMTRRRFIGAAALTVGSVALGACGVRYKDTYEGQLREGEWISRGPYKITITNNGDSSVKEVRIRSHWRIIDTRDRTIDEKTRAGEVKVGTVLTAEGRLKGYVGLYGDQTFWVITKDKLQEAVDNESVKLQDQSLETYYINNRYVEVSEK